MTSSATTVRQVSLAAPLFVLGSTSLLAADDCRGLSHRLRLVFPASATFVAGHRCSPRAAISAVANLKICSFASRSFLCSESDDIRLRGCVRVDKV
ncbi:hypothetical protein HDK77DRAFT_458420 [Phyllosticta capitalensis]